jgi:hypothetical protein
MGTKTNSHSKNDVKPTRMVVPKDTRTREADVNANSRGGSRAIVKAGKSR